MIYSMTGFGKAIVELPYRKITVEIKSLNSKQLDLSTRIPQIYKELEMDIRSEIARQLERGKVDFSIQIENKNNADSNAGFNVDIIKSYYTQLQSLTQSLQIPEPADWLQTLLRLPDALKSDVVEVSEEESQAVKKAVDEAIAHLIEFRAQEGLMLQKLFTEKIGNIARLLAEVEPYEKERTEKIKARIIEALKKNRELRLRQKPHGAGDDFLHRKTRHQRREKPPRQPPALLYRNDGRPIWPRQEVGIYQPGDRP